MQIVYSVNKSESNDIANHLHKVSTLFKVPLCDRVDIDSYSGKLLKYAVRFEAWSGNDLVGLVACYLNTEKKEAFISDVSVESGFQKRGIAKKLLEQCIRSRELEKCDCIRLMVFSDDNAAISLYEKSGFVIEGSDNGQYEMVLRKTFSDEVKVSICCVTYNHAPYIRQCLDGFLMQKTDFPIEILIHDDASTDGTQDIIREYEKKYPELIKPIYQSENQYSKGVKISLTYNWPRAKGKYIAMCEGDDYWTDPYKLQKQVDFLESHPEYVMCSHRFNQYIEDKNLLEEDQDKDFKGADYDLKNLIGGKWLTQTLTVMFRRSALDLQHFESYGMSMDMILLYELLRNGKGYCLPDIMAVYRFHRGGTWSEVSMSRQRKMEFMARISIYNLEKSDDAAMFVLFQFAKAMSRIWMLRQWSLFVKVVKILRRHYGDWFTMKLMFRKIVLGKGIDWDDVNKIKFCSAGR